MEKKSHLKNHNRSISNVEVHPKYVEVRKLCNITIHFKVRQSLPQSSTLIFRFRGGRNNKNDWYYLQTNDPYFHGYAKLIFHMNQSTKIIPLVITGKELAIYYFIDEKGGINKSELVEFSIQNTFYAFLQQSLFHKETCLLFVSV